MKITRQWLEKHNACSDGKKFFLNENILESIAGIQNLIKKHKINWANWLVVRCMTHKQQVQYAVYAAKQVLYMCEAKFPKDKRGLLAIKVALQFIKPPNTQNRNAAYATAYAAAYAAAHAADAAYAAANAADAAYAAANAAYAAANAAADVTAKIKIQIKIIQYGISLIKNKS